MPDIVIDLVNEEPANFYREKRRVAFVTGHLFTFLVVLSLICLVTTHISIYENQTTWRLEILLRTIVAALLKTKCNGRFVMNKRYQKAGKEYFRRVQMIVKDEGYKYFPARATFDAWSCPPSPPPSHKHGTHTNKNDSFALRPLPIPPSAHTTFFPIPITTNAQVFLSHCPKTKKNYSISLESLHEPNSTVSILNKSKKSIQT